MLLSLGVLVCSHWEVQATRFRMEPLRFEGFDCSVECLPRGSIVVPFWGSYLESYKVIPKRNYYTAYG